MAARQMRGTTGWLALLDPSHPKSLLRQCPGAELQSMRSLTTKQVTQLLPGLYEWNLNDALITKLMCELIRQFNNSRGMLRRLGPRQPRTTGMRQRVGIRPSRQHGARISGRQIDGQ